MIRQKSFLKKERTYWLQGAEKGNTSLPILSTMAPRLIGKNPETILGLEMFGSGTGGSLYSSDNSFTFNPN